MPDTSTEQAVAGRLLHPLEPLVPGLETRISSQQSKAVIFDIYGTLLISAAGDVGPDSAEDSEAAFLEALADGGWDADRVRTSGTALLQEEILAGQRRKRDRGIRFPEIDILRVWRRVLVRLGLLAEGVATEHEREIKNIRLTALSYECRINPVWPMPGLLETLAGLQAKGFLLGLLSNAQFYTPILFEFLCHQSMKGLGFEPGLCLFSYREGEGKPSPNLFADLASRLDGYAVAPSEVLYVGNDMLKDIRPAMDVGWRAALFAGDTRSLRLRRDEGHIRDLQPHLVIDNLVQLLDITG